MTTTSTYHVNGMTCGHCSSAVADELQSLAGVSAVRIDLTPGGTSEVHVTSEAELDVADIASAVDEAGYALAGPRDLPLA